MLKSSLPQGPGTYLNTMLRVATRVSASHLISTDNFSRVRKCNKRTVTELMLSANHNLNSAG